MAHDLKSKGKSLIQATPGRYQHVDRDEFTRELAERKVIVDKIFAQIIEENKIVLPEDEELRKDALNEIFEQYSDRFPRVTDSIGRKLLMTAEILSHKHYFIGYSWREDMVMYAMYDCIKYVDKFDPSRGTNPFAYFTQTCWYAFIRYLQNEKKQKRVKMEVIRNLGSVLSDLQVDAHDMDQDFKNHVSDLLNQLQEYDSSEKIEREIEAPVDIPVDDGEPALFDEPVDSYADEE